VVRLRMLRGTQLLLPIDRAGVAAHVVEPERPRLPIHHTGVKRVLAGLCFVCAADVIF
jgi:hypothetical protein